MSRGLDDKLQVRCGGDEKEEWRAAAEHEDVSLSEFVRVACDLLTDEHRDEIPDELTDAAERDRMARLQERDTQDAGLRQQTKSFVKSIHGSGWTAYEVEHALRRRYRQAELLPDELRPEAVVEYIDCLLVLLQVYDDDKDDDRTAELAQEGNNMPMSLYGAIDRLDAQYPDEHEDFVHELLRYVDMDEDELQQIDGVLHNGTLPEHMLQPDDEDGDDDDRLPTTELRSATLVSWDRLRGKLSDEQLRQVAFVRERANGEVDELQQALQPEYQGRYSL